MRTGIIQIARVDGDTVATDAGTWVEGLKTKRLGLGSFNDFPDINAEFMAEFRHLVDQTDVYVAISVLEEFCRLGFLGTFHLDHFFDELAVEEIRRRSPDSFVTPPTTLGVFSNV